MSKYLLPYFGELDYSNLKHFYETIFDFNGREILIDMEFENTSIDKKCMDNIKSFLYRHDKLSLVKK